MNKVLSVVLVLVTVLFANTSFAVTCTVQSGNDQMSYLVNVLSNKNEIVNSFRFGQHPGAANAALNSCLSAVADRECLDQGVRGSTHDGMARTLDPYNLYVESVSNTIHHGPDECESFIEGIASGAVRSSRRTSTVQYLIKNAPSIAWPTH